jgi:hypothetical protein
MFFARPSKFTVPEGGGVVVVVVVVVGVVVVVFVVVVVGVVVVVFVVVVVGVVVVVFEVVVVGVVVVVVAVVVVVGVVVDGAGAGGGATTPVASDVAVVEPLWFVAVTEMRSTKPTSADPTVYVEPPAPAIGPQALPSVEHRCHWSVYVIPLPLQVPVLAVMTFPIAAVPVAAGATRSVGTCCPGGTCCPLVCADDETVAEEATVEVVSCCPGAFDCPGGSCWPFEASTAVGTTVSSPTAAMSCTDVRNVTLPPLVYDQDAGPGERPVLL